MKKLLTFFIAGAAIAVLGGVFSACNAPKDSEQEGENVPFTVPHSGEDISEKGASAEWVVRDYFTTPRNEGNAFVINSDEELKKYVMGDDHPSFDFSKKTLLLVGGGGADRSPLKPSVMSFQYYPTGKYVIEIEVEQGLAAFGDIWRMAILTDKISSDSKIELNVTINE